MHHLRLPDDAGVLCGPDTTGLLPAFPGRAARAQDQDKALGEHQGGVHNSAVQKHGANPTHCGYNVQGEIG